MPHHVAHTTRSKSASRNFGPAHLALGLLISGASMGLASCGGSHGTLEPRFVAVHNTLTAMGLSQSGSISEGSLPSEGSARIDLNLRGGRCYTFVVFGSETVRNIDLQLTDAHGTELSRDTTHDREAALHACPRADGRHVLTITMVEGHGGYVTSYWSGGEGGGGSFGGQLALAAQGLGSCSEPIPLVHGTATRGDTRGGPSVLEGSCARGAAPERVFALEIATRSQVIATLESQFDGSIYIVAQCGVPDSELACNDDAGGTTRSQVQATLDPGTYFVVVDGYREQSGLFDLLVAVTEAPSIANVCSAAPLLALGQPMRGSTVGVPDSFQASCAGAARSPDRVYRVPVDVPSRVRVRMQSSYDGALHMRRVCADPSSELVCNDDLGDSHHSMVSALLSAGEYFLVVDGYGGNESGEFEINTELVPAAGTGTTGDTCQQPDALVMGRRIALDTLHARDDVSGTCGGEGSPDLLYNLNVTARSRLRATIEANEFPGVLYVQSRCGDRGSELSCSNFGVNHKAPVLDTTLTPGQYVLVVDGVTGGDFGAGHLTVQLEDLAATERLCREAPKLQPGREERGSTALGQDRFQASCANNAASNDVVYQLVVRRRSLARISLSADYDSALHLRSSCTEQRSEIACNDDQGDNRHSGIEAALDPGTYYVIVDGFRTGNQGNYTLNVQLDNL